MITQNTLIDNSSEKLLMSKNIRDFLTKPGLQIVRIATGYWDLLGLLAIQDELSSFLAKEGTQLQLLIGKDPFLYPAQKINPTYKDASYPGDFIRRDINELGVKDEYEKSVNILLEYCQGENPKFQVRIYKTNEQDEAQFLHSKCYIFSGLDENGDSESIGIVGSSNFTGKGLDGNAELNYAETSSQIVEFHTKSGSAKKGHIQWFEERWDISKEWTKEFLEQVIKETEIAKEIIKKEEEKKSSQEESPAHSLTPYELYIKYLQTQIGDIADPSIKSILKSYLPQGYSALDYQLDAVTQCFYIMKQHGGFMLGDVVGLGKTIVGVLLIKKYLDECSAMGRERKVLIIVPPAIKASWVKTIEEFDLGMTDKISPCVTFITTGSISKLVDGFGEGEMEDIESEGFDTTIEGNDYGFILIDESHNFKNSQTQKYKDLDDLIGDIEVHKGYVPFIGLLSATPQNNSPRDIKNQIYLFQRNPEHTTLAGIPGGKLGAFFTDMEVKFSACRKVDTPDAHKKLKEVAKEIRDKVLCDVLVRRTRSDIKSTYPVDAASLKFPTIVGPTELDYKLVGPLSTLFCDTVEAITYGDETVFNPAKHIGFRRYGAISFLISDADRNLYKGRGNRNPDEVSKQLANIMKIMLVKRLESSFAAFKDSLSNLRDYTQYMIDMFDSNCVYICPDIHVNEIIKKAGSLKAAMPEIDRQIAKKGGNNRSFHASAFTDDYIKELKDDYKVIDNLYQRWSKVYNDPKLDKFNTILKSTLFDPSINNPHKFDSPRLVIFTEAIATQELLESSIAGAGYRVLKVNAKNRDVLRQTIEENFDAMSKNKKDDYDVLVTTEVLAEGVNLHRSNVILNYDSPWNSTRLMQRIGRVNRIGSKEDFVHVYNFYPTSEGEEQINLVKISYAKLQSFHDMFGEDNKVFSANEKLAKADFNHIFDEEESPMNEYIKDLKDFQMNLPARYDEIKLIPYGNLGGEIVGYLGNKTVVIISAAKRGASSVLVDMTNTTAFSSDIISPIDTMKFLKCPVTDIFEKKTFGILPEEIKEEALRCYAVYVDKMTTAGDTTKLSKEALEKIRFDLRPKLSTDAAKKALKDAEKAIRANNKTVARKVIKLANDIAAFGPGIWDTAFDINSIIEGTFNHITTTTAVTYGTPVIDTFKIK